MTTLLVSTKGQIVLLAALRRRLGIGARLEVIEMADDLKLRVIRIDAASDTAGLAGMVKAPAHGIHRWFLDFDPAMLPTRSPAAMS